MRSLWKNATPNKAFVLQQAAWLCDTADAVGRPGECKFGSYSEWEFDFKVGCPNTPWAESKTLKKYGMSRICDDFFGFDWFCNIGAFWMCNDGLARNADQISKGQMNAVFPNLHDVSNAYVAKKLTNAVRCSLERVPHEIRKKFSAKSIRKGMITEIAMSPFITLFNVCARSGHWSGTSLESYMDCMNPLRSLPADNALHGNPLNMEPVMPDIDAVGGGNREQVEALLEELFVVDVPDFKRGGRLRIILETCFASMIRHLPEIVRLCGGHCLVASTLFRAAEMIGLTDARYPNLNPKSVLLQWSEMVSDKYRQEFDAAKLKTMNSSADAGALFNMLSQVARDVKELKEEKRNTELELAKEKALTDYLSQQNETL